MDNQNISDEYLNSLIDDQLNLSEKTHALEAIRKNDNMKERVCELRNIKEMIKHAYTRPPEYIRPPVKRPPFWPARFQAIAACLLLIAGSVSGWFFHEWSSRANNHDIISSLQSSQHSKASSETRKIIVHISNSNPMKLKAALDETESLLDTYKRTNRQIQIELIANKQGVNLLRTNVSAYENRINMMQGKYPNLNFMVCGQTISKLRSDGEDVQLVTHTEVASSAAHQINKRLLQGWGYVRI